MLLFAVAVARTGGQAPDLSSALARAAVATPQLDPGSLATARSPSGRVSLAHVSHGPGHAHPRRYTARSAAQIVIFDGFPIDGRDAFAANDAAALREHWDELPARLDGIFTALRVDCDEDTVECLTDALGMARVFVHRGEGAVLLSNSVEAIRIQAGLAAPDALGLSTLLSLGYVARGRTLLAGVEMLTGGTLHRFAPAGDSNREYFGPSLALAAKPPKDALVPRLLGTARAGARTGAALRSGLTSGRDSRVLLALLMGAQCEREVDFYTSGLPADLDVRIARELADRGQLRHRLTTPRAPHGRSWAEQTTQFVKRTDGLSNLELISDWVDHEETFERVSLEFWGGGGEIGRPSKRVLGTLFGTTPLLRRSYLGRRSFLEQAAGDPARVLHAGTLDLARRHVGAFIQQRREERWPADALLEAYYTFEFLPARPGVGVRRAAASADLFSPFVCRAFVEHCFSISAGERYLECPHRTIVKTLAPQIDTVPYQTPWKPERPRFVWPVVAGAAGHRVVDRFRGVSPESESIGTPFYVDWFEAGLELHRELVLSSTGSPVWDFVDRTRYEQLLTATPEEREPFVKHLCRVLSAFWYFNDLR